MTEQSNFNCRNFDLLVSNKRRKEIFERLGYTVTQEGDLIDNENSQRVLGKDNEVINLNKSKKVAFVLGSHNFVKNVSEYSEILAKEGKLIFSSEQDVSTISA